MSMTQEEAIELLRDTPIDIRSTREDDIHTLYATAQMMAIDALRPVSRERIEKVWKGEWIKERRQTYIPVEYDEQGEVILHDFVVYRCSICGRENTKEEPFCNCGAPMTDAAVLTVMDRLEALKDDC